MNPDQKKFNYIDIMKLKECFLGTLFCILLFVVYIISMSFLDYYRDDISNFSLEKVEYRVNQYYNTDYYNRVEYLTASCKYIPGLEVLNSNKSSFICSDGKIYLEKIPIFLRTP